VTRFRVEWAPELKAHLAERWIKADSRGRARLTQLNDVVDRELASDADCKGKPVRGEPGVRAFTIGGARVLAEVDSGDRLVYVVLIRFPPVP
jgi:hypothetical protein